MPAGPMASGLSLPGDPGLTADELPVRPLVAARLVDLAGTARCAETRVLDAERRPDFRLDELFPGVAGTRLRGGAGDGVAQVRIGELTRLRGRRLAEVVHGHRRTLRTHAFVAERDRQEFAHLAIAAERRQSRGVAQQLFDRDAA